jgi:hypothetical protein
MKLKGTKAQYWEEQMEEISREASPLIFLWTKTLSSNQLSKQQERKDHFKLKSQCLLKGVQLLTERLLIRTNRKSH